MTSIDRFYETNPRGPLYSISTSSMLRRAIVTVDGERMEPDLIIRVHSCSFVAKKSMFGRTQATAATQILRNEPTKNRTTNQQPQTTNCYHARPPQGAAHGNIYLICTEKRSLVSSPKEPEHPKKTKRSFSRRGFLAGMGVTSGALTTGILET